MKTIFQAVIIVMLSAGSALFVSAMGRTAGTGTAYSSPQNAASQAPVATSPAPYDSNAVYSGTSHTPVAPGNQPTSAANQVNQQSGTSPEFPVAPTSAGMPGSPGVSGTGAPVAPIPGTSGTTAAGSH